MRALRRAGGRADVSLACGLLTVANCYLFVSLFGFVGAPLSIALNDAVQALLMRLIAPRVLNQARRRIAPFRAGGPPA